MVLAQYLQGIGSGSEASLSGESAVFRKLMRETGGANRELCIFDVGANEGQWLALARSLSWRSPVQHPLIRAGAKQLIELLLENAGHRKDAVLNNCGLGREPGERELFYDATAGSRLASLTKRKLDHFGIRMELSEKVRMSATIDDLLHRSGD